MPNLRGRKDHEREQERSGSDYEAESNEEFDFRSSEEAKGRSAEEVHGGNNQREDPKGLKIEHELETTNSDKSRDGLETNDSVRMFDSEMPNQLKANWKEGQHKRGQHHDNKGAGKRCRSR